MRILVVEDEEKVSGFLHERLEAEGYDVEIAKNGRSAKGCLRDSSYDIIVLDLKLPDIPGGEILVNLRKTDQQVPVLILTAKARLSDKLSHFEMGADDYLTKPFSFAELLLRIKALLKRGSTNRGNTLQVADLHMDRIARKVRRSSQEIELTLKEFSLLEYLMLNVGKVVSRSMIVDKVWDHSFEGFTNITDVYVRQLRKKIDEEFEPKLIRTVRGVGYMMSDREEEA